MWTHGLQGRWRRRFETICLADELVEGFFGIPSDPIALLSKIVCNPCNVNKYVCILYLVQTVNLKPLNINLRFVFQDNKTFSEISLQLQLLLYLECQYQFHMLYKCTKKRFSAFRKSHIQECIKISSIICTTHESERLVANTGYFSSR